jgi:dienelactone hydrolase
MKILSLILAILYSILINAQKREIDSTDYGSWPNIGLYKISPNGQFILHDVNDSRSGKNKCVVNAIFLKKWEKSFWNVQKSEFSADSKNLLVLSNDDLDIFDLKSKKSRFIHHVSSFTTFKNTADNWIVYKMRTTDSLFALNLNSNEKISIPKVFEYFINPCKSQVVYSTIDALAKKQHLLSLDLNSNTCNSLAIHDQFISVKFTSDGEGILFLSRLGQSRSIFGCLHGSVIPKIIVSDTCHFLKGKQTILGIDSLIFDDYHIVFSAQEVVKDQIKAEDWTLKLWRSSDSLLHSSYNERPSVHSDSKILYNLNTDHFVQLIKNGETVLGVSPKNIVIYGNLQADPKSLSKDKMFSKVISIYDLQIDSIYEANIPYAAILSLSPDGKKIAYYDWVKRFYMCYDINRRSNYIVSSNTSIFRRDLLNGEKENPFQNNGIVGWLSSKEFVVHDSYDIWKVNINDTGKSKCLTNFWGRKTGTVFSANNPFSSSIFNDSILIVRSFNMKTYKNGFFSINLKKSTNPVELMSGDFVYTFPRQYLINKNATRSYYLFYRQSEKESNNIYYTFNFHSIKQITKLDPEKDVNWLSAEICRYIITDTSNGIGILYKPENFNPKIKYPVVIYYYEIVTNKIHEFLLPEVSRDIIDIPTLVSKGYLVFRPDIVVRTGEAGQSAVSSVLSAAYYLKTFSYVDSTRIGIQGHSFGGYETNFILCKSGNTFAAALSAAGISNLSSLYSCQSGSQIYMEIGQFRMGESFAENTDIYIKNSPIFFARGISTPLLIMHNNNDKAVPFIQSYQLYCLLRRLGKKVWMLQYENEGHWIDSDEAALDYTRKALDFFDYYLRGKQKPDWF